MNRSTRLKAAAAICSALATIVVSYSSAQNAETQSPLVENPYSPAYGHSYRHGVIPTQDAWRRMRQWEARHATTPGVSPLVSSNTLSFGGGIDGIGVTSNTPRVYIVFWGSQWTSGGDPNGAASYLQHLFSGIGTGGESWSGTMTQYCDGSSVPSGATSCPSGAPLVGYPNAGALAGVWSDTSASAPANATVAQLAAEAVAAAAHFGNTSAASNRYAQYIVASPSGTHPDGFGSAGFCAWHNYTTSSYGDVAYTNMPYVTDLGASCGENYVNSGSLGTLDGFSIVGGHEYAETLTDQNPFGGWSNPSNNHAEDGDECAWIKSGQGAAANVSMGNGAYAMQSTWSNDTSACEISHTILTTSMGTPQFTDWNIAGCNGLWSVDWTTVSNAASYQIWSRDYPSTTWIRAKISSTTSALVRSPNTGGGNLFEVRACNGSECGPFSNNIELDYYSGCP